MTARFRAHLSAQLDELREGGLYKEERVISSAQGAEITLADGRRVLNFCANNYLGLSGERWVAEAAAKTLESRGYGLSSVRFICGTQDIHRELESKIAHFVGSEDAILYAACFDANAAVFEALLGREDAIITDRLNHASIIDGIRLCKAQRHIYANADLEDLEAKLKDAQGARFRLVVTDGVFSMDGTLAPLEGICELAERHDAMVLVDDSHASGFIGPGGRGTPAHFGVEERVHIITSTLGKALGGGSGGFIAAGQQVVDMLRQVSRPYLFSNTVAPAIVGASLAVLERLEESAAPREKLFANTQRFRQGMLDAGFELLGEMHPITPVVVHDAVLAGRMAEELLDEGIYVIGFSYPVVPRGEARIRVQISAAHEEAHIERAVEAFAKIGRRHGVCR